MQFSRLSERKCVQSRWHINVSTYIIHVLTVTDLNVAVRSIIMLDYDSSYQRGDKFHFQYRNKNKVPFQNRFLCFTSGSISLQISKSWHSRMNQACAAPVILEEQK